MGASSSQEMAVVEIPATSRHLATVIFLHGLGDTCHGWADQMRAFHFKHIKCVCPTAPIQPVSLNGGMRMTSWFDILGLGPECPEDESGIKSASLKLKDLIDKEESNGIPSNKVIIGGFSQGGAVALYTAFTLTKPLAGVLALSSWLPLNKQFPEVVVGNKNTPLFLCHGTADPLVPCHWGHLTYQLIKSFDPNAKFKTYEGMPHSSCKREMDDVKKYIMETLGLEP
ncbi:acyl-protein thioesterase 1 isoform X1 [Octopus vulgaris]|uniref:palmitoyl-protein hydrolase n=1 Tax=Octopus vulgaris TaxID=6645 RepID=A0AA36BYW4_OCTVU|nr:acyl-protein thioesterase 1 isoform X1 [Octopus vulgaris]